MARDEYGHYVNDEGVEIKASTSSSGNTKIDIYDSCPAENENHGSIHINFDENTGKGTITDTTSGEKETTDVSCYLTTACMQYLQENFDEKCDELQTLRWFRDNFVSQEDIEHYYEIAPRIVESINQQENSNAIYNYIYENIISVCIKAIKNKDYDFAYTRYKSSVLVLEKEFVKEKKLVLV